MAQSQGTMRTPLGRVRGLGSAKDGTEHFWRQRLTAIANIPLVIFFVIFLISQLGNDHAEVVAAIGHPLVAIGLLAVIVSVVIHMRLGMQVVIEDYISGEGTKIALLVLNTFFSIAVGLSAIFAIMKLGFGG